MHSADRIEWGGELIWAISEVDVREAPWAQARHALLAAMIRMSGGGRIELDRVTSMGQGLSRHGFGAHIDVVPDPRGLSGSYIALLPHRETDAEYPARVRGEARVLEWIWPRIRGLRVPRALVLFDDVHAPILVTSFVAGIAVDLRNGRMPIVPWQIVAEAAAAVHATEPPPAEVLPTRDRRQHRAEVIEDLFKELEDLSGMIGEAYTWMRAHVDRPGPGVLLHGDLLGQNLRPYPFEEMELGVIDWEHAAVGDPAHDLAIVTRGKRQPFQHASGRDNLLAAYNACAGVEVTRADLCFFELALHVQWSSGSPHERDASLAAIVRLLRSAARAGDER